MSLFKTKKKTIVDATAVRVIEDQFLPEPLVGATMEAIRGGDDFTKVLMEMALNGSFRNFENMYKYAEKGKNNGGYTYGLPNVNLKTNYDGYDILRGILQAQHPSAIDVEYVHFRPPSNFHLFWQYLFEDADYRHTYQLLGDLSAEKGRWVFLEKVIATQNKAIDAPVREENSGGNWENFTSNTVIGSPVPSSEDLLFGTDPADDPYAINLNQAFMSQIILREVREGPTETDGVEYHYVWADLDGTVHRESRFLDLSSYDFGNEYYQAKYSVMEQGVETWYYWTYSVLQGLYPTLDAVFEKPEYVDPGTFFPIVVFRDNKEDRSVDATEADPEAVNSDEFITTTKLLDYIGVDYASLGKQINENPDIGDVEQVAMIMAVQLNSQEPVEIDYLHRFFNSLYDKLPEAAKTNLYGLTTELSNADYRTSTNSAFADESYVWNFWDNNYASHFSFDGMSRRLVAGELAPDPDGLYGLVGAVTNELAVIDGVNYSFLTGGWSEDIEQTQHVLRKQITPHVYEEIRIINAKMRYHVIDGKSAVSLPDDDNIFLIMLDHDICKDINTVDRTKLYHRSLHLIFFSFVIQKTKWYESSIFKFVLVAIAIVIAVITIQPQIASVIASVVTGGSVTYALLIWLVKKLVLGFVIGLVLNEVVKELGLEESFIIAALLVAVSFLLPEVDTDTTLTGVMQHLTAENLLMAGTMLIKSVEEVLALEFQDLATAMEELERLQEEAWEELDDVSELLYSNSNLLDPFGFIGTAPAFIPGETPDGYIARSIHTGNIGVKSLEIIENFVDESLKLPTLANESGEFIYG